MARSAVQRIMADILQLVIRFVHIGSAVALIGGATLWGAVIAPTLARMGSTLPKGTFPTLGAKLNRFLPMAAWGTLLGGVASYWYVQAYANETWKMLMWISLAITALMLAISYAVVSPTFKKLTASMTATQGPPTAEARSLMVRLTKASMLNLALGWIVVAIMVVAVSLRVT